MDNGWAVFVEFLPEYTRSAESGEGGEDRAANPCRPMPLRRVSDFDSWHRRCHSLELLLHPSTHPSKHGVTTSEENLVIHVFLELHVALSDRLAAGFVDTKQTPYPGVWVGTRPQGTGNAHCQSQQPDHQEASSSVQGLEQTSLVHIAQLLLHVLCNLNVF